MPTGYTACVSDGTVTDLKTFAMRLARGMGACVSMRDEPHDAPLPERFEPSPYHGDRVRELIAQIGTLNALTPEQADAEARKAMVEFEADREADKQKWEERRARYQAMIAKVEAWEGAPEGIKEFGLDQLRESLKLDCGPVFRFWGQPPPECGKAWRAARLAELNNDLAYHAKANAEEAERVASRNAWLAQLRASLEGQDIAATLAERGTRYGDFEDHARITQAIKGAMADSPNWARLPSAMKESLEMVAHKIGRILNGDPNYHDSWHDIIGYTKLVADKLA